MKRLGVRREEALGFNVLSQYHTRRSSGKPKHHSNAPVVTHMQPWFMATQGWGNSWRKSGVFCSKFHRMFKERVPCCICRRAQSAPTNHK